MQGLRSVAVAALTAFCAGIASAQPPSIRVSYPYDDPHAMPYSKGAFVIGVATPTGGVLSINASTVAQHTNGGFLAWVPVEPGSFTLHIEYAVGGSTAAFDRRLLVGKPLAPSPTGALLIDPDFTLPAGDVELREGDWLTVQVKGTPGKKAEFKVAGTTGWTAMNESAPGSGLYQYALAIGPGFKAREAAVHFRLREGFWRSVGHEAPGKVTAPAALRVVETSTDTVVLRSGANRGYILFPFKGTRLLADGRMGSQVRVRLSPDESGWTGSDTLRLLPEGTPPPEAVLGGAIRTAVAGRETQVRMDLSEAVPVGIVEDGDWLRLKLSNTVGHVSWVVYDSSDTLVREVRWRQADSRTAEVSVRRDPSAPLWGWRTTYSPGVLTLTLRRPPSMEPWGPSPMKGLTIVLDPGHSPGKQEGAVGPTGVWEADVAFSIAQQLKPMLEADGATVLLTREAGEEKTLYDRVRFAWERRGDLYLSLHIDALPDDVNPYAAPRGFKVFYYHPLSLEFARAMHRSYQKSSIVPDEGLRYGNLLVARESGMPAILTESDFLMFPEREERLLKPDYLKSLARIHRDGIITYLRTLVKAPPPAAGPPTQLKEKELHGTQR